MVEKFVRAKWLVFRHHFIKLYCLLNILNGPPQWWFNMHTTFVLITIVDPASRWGIMVVFVNRAQHMHHHCRSISSKKYSMLYVAFAPFSSGCEVSSQKKGQTPAPICWKRSDCVLLQKSSIYSDNILTLNLAQRLRRKTDKFAMYNEGEANNKTWSVYICLGYIQEQIPNRLPIVQRELTKKQNNRE